MLIFLAAKGYLTPELSLWAISCGAAIALFLGLLRYKQYGLLKRPDRKHWSQALKTNWVIGKWLLATNAAYWFGSQLVIYMAGAVLSVEAVGAMSATRNVVGVTHILFLGMENLVPPRAARTYAAGAIIKLNSYLIRVATIGGIITLAIVLLVSFLSKFLLNFLYGSAYEGYSWLIPWWGVSYLLVFFHRPLTTGLRVLAHTRDIFYANLGGTILAILLAYFALRSYGLAGGMAIICLIQATVLMILAMNYLKVTRKLSAI
jgi:O-antigen/teichoic acid export membrane protein